LSSLILAAMIAPSIQAFHRFKTLKPPKTI
jgi:hypothetical protein